jgi:hypothetical protein
MAQQRRRSNMDEENKPFVNKGKSAIPAPRLLKANGSNSNHDSFVETLTTGNHNPRTLSTVACFCFFLGGLVMYTIMAHGTNYNEHADCS